MGAATAMAATTTRLVNETAGTISSPGAGAAVTRI